MRPWWWIAIAAGFAVSLTISDIRGVIAAHRGRREWPAVTSTVAEGYVAGRHRVPITYVHPVTRQKVDVEVVVVNESSLPRPGSRFLVAVDPSDPDRIAVPGDGDPTRDTVLGWSVIMGATFLAAGARWTAIARTERLIRSARPSFAMLATLTSSGRGTVGAHCSVYALDAAAGELPLCSFRVLTSGGLPIDGPAFPVEVRGRPVPGGLLVARCGERIIRPVRRPLGRGSVVRPPDVIDVPPTLPETPAPPAGTRTVSPLWRCLGPLAGACLVSAAVITAVVVPRLIIGERHDRALARTGDAVVVRVLSKSGNDLQVQYIPPTGAPRLWTIVGSDERVVGRLYPAHIDGADGIRLDGDGFDSVTPVIVLLTLWAVTLGIAWPRVRWWRDARRAAVRGPWYRAVGQNHGSDLLVCAPSPDARGHVASARTHPTAPGRNVDLQIAGSLDPDAALAIAGPCTGTGRASRWDEHAPPTPGFPEDR